MLIIIAIIQILFSFFILYIVRSIYLAPRLKNYHPMPNSKPELVSVIVPACNEEATIKEGMNSLLNLTYPNLEFILVNDRSSDKTGKIIKEMAKRDERIKYLEIKHLPEMWLGKLHAVYQATKIAKGTWLIFTDADIHFHPSTVDKAISFLETHSYDHLTLAPKIYDNSILFKGLIIKLKMNLFLFLRPQIMHKKSSSAGMGIGAFNMIKKDVYDKIGGHEAIKLCVDDDVMFGKLIKMKGFTPSFAIADDLVKVDWYKDIPAMFKGLEKNSLPPFLYSITLMFLSYLVTGLLYISPFLGIFLFDGYYRCISFFALVIIMIFFSMNDYFSKKSVILAIFFPLIYALFIFMLTFGAYNIKRRGGIRWRDTFYPIELLKKHCKIE